MKILIFTDGLIVNEQNFSVYANVKEKINAWIENGAEVEFLTDKYKFMDAKKLDDALKSLGLANPKIHTKQPDEKFLDLVLESKPNLVLETPKSTGDSKTIKERISHDKGIRCMIVMDEKQLVELPDLPEDVLSLCKEMDSDKQNIVDEV